MTREQLDELEHYVERLRDRGSPYAPMGQERMLRFVREHRRLLAVVAAADITRESSMAYLKSIAETGREKGIGFCVQVAFLAIAEIQKAEAP